MPDCLLRVRGSGVRGRDAVARTALGRLVLSLIVTMTGCRTGQDGGTHSHDGHAPTAVPPPAPAPSPADAGAGGGPRALRPARAEVETGTNGRPSVLAVEPPLSPGPSTPPEAAAPGPRRAYHVAALGDSITDESVGGGGYLRYLRRACPKSKFVHFGKGGDMTNQMRRRLLRDLLPAHQSANFDTLIVFGGVNDLYSDVTAGRTNALIEADLGAIYADARGAGLRVVAISVSPWGGFTRYFNERRSRSTRLLNSWILGTVAEGRTEAVVDSYALLSCGDPVRLCPAYENRRPDGLHPGPGGHERLGEALQRVAFADCQ